VVRSGRGTTVRGNSIFANGGLAVDLSPNGADQPPDGVTPNDDLDADGGPNELQNAPVLAAFVGDAVQGTLHSTPDTTFTVDVYQSTGCGDATRHAETPVATASVTTDAAGDAQLSIPLGPGTGYLTATATAADGSTSEPSPCLDYVLSGDRELRIVAPAEITAGGETPIEVRVVIAGSVVDPSFDGQATVRLDPSGTPDLAELVSGSSSGASLTVTMADGELAEPLLLRTPPGWSPMMTVEAVTVLEGTVELRAEADGDLAVAAAIDVETPLDLAIDRIEVQQGPRTLPLNDMIRNRWIMVRVFVEDRGELFDRFAGLVDLTGALHVTDQDGTPVPGSPFELKDSRWVGNSNRNRPFVLRPNYDARRRWRGENAFNVLLDPLPSRRLELRAELDEVFPDRDRGNEEGELGPMRFRDTRPATVLYQLARGTNGGTTTELPEMAHIQASMRFMDLAYPVSSRSIRWVRLQDREYDGIPLWTGEDELPLWLSLPDVVNPVGLVTFVDDQYLPLFGRGRVLGITNRLGGTNAVVNSDDCGPPRNDCSTLAHEIGHMYRLGDTYAGGGENPAVNPLRPDATASGNWVENGTFNWFSGWYAERYDRYLSFDFMGNGRRAWTDVATWDALAPRFRTPTAKTLRAGDTVLVRGTVFNGGGGELSTAYTLDGLAPPDDPGGSFTIALVGQGGGTLASTTFEPSFDVTDSDIPAPEDRFGVVLPWDDRARRIELRSGGAVLDERPISASDPIVAFTASPTGSLDGDVSVAWEGSDPDGDPVVYSLFFSPDGALHVPIVSETTATSVTWDGFEAFAGDAPRLVLVASDGVRSVRVESATFDVPDRPPEVAISEPADGGVYALGADVPLSASVLDREDGLPFAPDFRWSSDRDGGLGGGNDRAIATLSAGTHVITATYSDTGGNDASASVEITVVDGPVCTLTCEPTVPDTGIVGETITFAAGVATDSCSDPVDVRWFLAGGSGAAGDPVDRTFTEPGSYPWAVVATAGAARCEGGGLLEIGVGGDVDPAWIVPTVAHAIGFGDSRWRSDVAVVNLAAGRVVVQLTFVRNDAPVSRSIVLQPGATVQYRDVLVSLFGFADSASVSGSLHVATDGLVTVASRTYNQSDDGTYGQFLPAVEIDGPLAPGEAATLPQLRSDGGFYTNIGFVNTSGDTATVQVILRGADGAAIGDPLYASLEAGRWRQLNDVFDGLGDVPIAYADVEVVAGGGSVWAYASVVDRLTRDPTTIPIVR